MTGSSASSLTEITFQSPIATLRNGDDSTYNITGSNTHAKVFTVSNFVEIDSVMVDDSDSGNSENVGFSKETTLFRNDTTNNDSGSLKGALIVALPITSSSSGFSSTRGGGTSGTSSTTPARTHNGTRGISNLKAFSSLASFNMVQTGNSSHDHYLVQTASEAEENVLHVTANINKSGHVKHEQVMIDLAQLFVSPKNYKKQQHVRLHTIVHTSTFIIQSSRETQHPLIKIICVDANLNILKLHLLFHNHDNDSLQLELSQVDYIPTPIASTLNINMDKPNNVYNITSQRIQFISHEHLLFINYQHQITNYLLPSHNNNKHSTIAIWKSIQQCLDYKKQSLGYFTKTKGLLIGKSQLDLLEESSTMNNNDTTTHNNTHQDSDHDQLMVDYNASDNTDNTSTIIPPTVAICILQNHCEHHSSLHQENKNIIKAICSLHIDGTVLLWTLLPTFATNVSKIKMYPVNVRKLQTDLTLQSSMPSIMSIVHQIWNQLQDDNSNSCINKNFESCIHITGAFMKKNDKSSSFQYYSNNDDDDEEENYFDNGDENSNTNCVIGIYLQSFDEQIQANQYSLTMYTFQLDTQTQIKMRSTKLPTTPSNIHELVVPTNFHSLIDMDVVSSDGYSNILSKFHLNFVYNCKMTIDESVKSIIDNGSITDIVQSIQFAMYPLTDNLTSSSSSNEYYVTTIQPIMMNYQGKDSSFTTIDSLALKQQEEIILQTNILVEDVYEEQGMFDDECDVESLLQSVDQWYMKKLFKPPYGRRVGCHASIHRALMSIVPTLCTVNYNDVYAYNSLEMKTIITMRKWIELSVQEVSDVDDSSSSTMNVDMNMSPPSIIVEGNESIIDKHSKSSEIDRRFMIHHKCWFQLLLAVLSEEAKLQIPLRFIFTSKDVNQREIGIVVRAGFTTVLTVSHETDGDHNTNAITKLDELAILLLKEFEMNSSNKPILVNFEMKIWDIISKAALIFKDEATLVDTLLENIIDAFATRTWNRFSADVINSIQGMSSETLIAWLSSLHLSSSRIQRENSDTPLYQESVLHLQFAANIAQSRLDSIGRFALFRCILIAGIRRYNNANILGTIEEKAATRTYLHTVSLIWMHSQMACTTFEGCVTKDEMRAPPPPLAFNSSKMSRMQSMSQRQNCSTHTIIEHVLKNIVGFSTKGLTFERYSGEIINITKHYLQLMFKDDNPVPDFVQDLQNKFRFTLRASAPFISYCVSIPSLSFHDTIGLNKMVAESLLVEVDTLVVSKCISQDRAKELLRHAFGLLVSHMKEQRVQPDVSGVQTFFSTMRSLPENWISSRSVSADQFYDNTLFEVLMSILGSHMDYIDVDDVKQLAKMDTTRKLFLPWILASQEKRKDPLDLIMEGLSKSTLNPNQVVTETVLVLLRISCMINSVILLENHAATSINSELKAIYADVLLSGINGIIQDVQINLSMSICGHMSEYAALWSSAFRHAILAHHWDDAFKACISNPLEERRENNFKRLVLAMVESGALIDLMKNIIFTVSNWKSSSSESNCNEGMNIDLYELAAQTLAQAATERPSSGIAHFGISSSAKVNVDYRGCLFALHAAHDDWRRCCQTLDLYGLISHNSLLESADLATSDKEKKEIDEVVINELVLSSVSLSQLIHLVPEDGQRFIITGEITSNPSPPSFRKPPTGNGKQRSSFPTELNIMSRSVDGLDRVSRILNEQELSMRATRLMALRTLYHDFLSPESLIDIIDSSDSQLIEALSRLGYFSQVIGIANCKKDDKQGVQPSGRDILIDSISHMICEHMLPNVNKILRSPITDENMDDGLDLDGTENRPTLNQLRLLLGNGSLPLSCTLWKNDMKNKAFDRGTMAMNLVQSYTMMYAGAGNSLATEIAQTLLDLDSGRAELPRWLHNFIVGKAGTNGEKSFCSGLFAQRNKGNPAELVRIYMRNGLLSNACNVVTEVLTGEGNQRVIDAPSRLPERGSIDFVPFNLIDQLWNVIETYIHHQHCESAMKKQLIESRAKMEKAIEKHFELMKISEMGMISARALTSR